MKVIQKTSLVFSVLVCSESLCAQGRYVEPEYYDDVSRAAQTDDGIWFGVFLLAVIIAMVLKYGDDAAGVMMAVAVVSLPAIIGIAMVSGGNNVGYALMLGSVYWAYRWFWSKD
jgi:hypothetical protein